MSVDDPQLRSERAFEEIGALSPGRASTGDRGACEKVTVTRIKRTVANRVVFVFIGDPFQELAASSYWRAPSLEFDFASGRINQAPFASGVVESEKEGKLYLNTTPCKPAQEADTVVFHKPYTKTPAGEIVCYGHHFDKVSVRQQ